MSVAPQGLMTGGTVGGGAVPPPPLPWPAEAAVAIKAPVSKDATMLNGRRKNFPPQEHPNKGVST